MLRVQIGKAFSRHPRNSTLCPLYIVNSELGASILPEIELCQITVKMLFIDVLIDADKARFRTEKNPSKVFVCTSPRVIRILNDSTVS